MKTAKIVLAAVVAMLGVPGAVAAADNPVVRTDAGLVTGTVADGYRVFSGVPFAAPPVGELRWRAPRPVRPWTGVRDATNPSPRCAQTGGAARRTEVEDCLYLDVTAPATPGRKPVMVWLHGGGNSFLNASDFDAHRLAVSGNVVVVSVNFRLGVFGSFSLPQLGNTPSFTLEDQQAALRWVRRNAAAFGGNPSNVTLFGESGGGYDVCEQLASPAARGLFDRAIMQSGSCSMTWPVNGIKYGDPAGSPWISVPQLRSQSAALAARVGCADPRTVADCLRRTPAGAIVDASPTPVTTPMAYGNRTLPERPDLALAAGHFPRIPVLSGTTRDEAALTVGFLTDQQLAYGQLLRQEFGAAAPRVWAAYPAKDNDPWVTRALALTAAHTDRVWSCGHLTDDRLLARHTAVYAYEFADRDAPTGFFTFPPQYPPRAYHSAEVTYFLDQGFPYTFRPDQQMLSEQMIGYWTAFAATGDPNRAGQPHWSRFTGANAQSLAPGAVKGVDLDTTHHCEFWSTL